MLKLKKIMNNPEQVTHADIKDICSRHNAFVYPKVRIADVFEISNSGISSREYSFALKSHFDFTVYDKESNPLFSVEFDGPGHKEPNQMENDELKDNLCRYFNFPLLRISYEYITNEYRNMTILGWFIETWFASKYFEEAQENGEIDYYEPFIASGFSYIQGLKNKFPLCLSSNERAKMFELFSRGHIKFYVPSVAIFKDDKKNYHSIGWIYIDDTKVAFVKENMQGQFFPTPIHELIDELTTIKLYAHLMDVLNGKAMPISLEELEKSIKFYNSSYSFCFGCYYKP